MVPGLVAPGDETGKGENGNGSRTRTGLARPIPVRWCASTITLSDESGEPMTAIERRGRRLFLVLATLTVLWKLGGVGLMVSRHGHGATTFLSLALALITPFLWGGAIWLQRAVG